MGGWSLFGFASMSVPFPSRRFQGSATLHVIDTPRPGSQRRGYSLASSIYWGYRSGVIAARTNICALHLHITNMATSVSFHSRCLVHVNDH